MVQILFCVTFSSFGLSFFNQIDKNNTNIKIGYIKNDEHFVFYAPVTTSMG